MQIETISIVGFGRLTNAEFSFHPGINLIVGPNEAGKSTLLQAIFAMLYGLYDSGSPKGSRRELMSVFQPWGTTGEYRASLTFSLADGQKFRVERNFGNRMKTYVYLLPHKQDVSGRFRSDSHGRLYFADDLLGMNRTVFENTCCLRQSELVKLEDSATAIADAIMGLATAGAGDANSTQAIGLLETMLRDEIGSPRAWTKPLATAQSELKRLGQAVATATERQEQMWSIVREINQYEERIAHLTVQKERHEYLKVLAEQMERQQARTRVDHVRKGVARQQQAVTQLEQYANIPVDLLDDLLRCADRRTRLMTKLSQTNADRQGLEQQFEALKKALERRVESFGESEFDLDMRPATRDRILSLHERWRHAVANKEKAEQLMAVTGAELDRLLIQFESEKVTHSSVLKLGAADLAKLHASFDQARHQLESAERELGRAETEWRRVGMDENTYQTYATQAKVVAIGEGVPAKRKGCNPFRSSQTPVDGEPIDLVIFQEIAPIHDALTEARASRDEALNQFQQIESRARFLLDIRVETAITGDFFAAKTVDLERVRKLETQVQMQKWMYDEKRSQVGALEIALAETRSALLQAIKTQGVETEDPELGFEAYMGAFDREANQSNARAKYETQSTQIELIAAQLRQLREVDSELAQTEQQILNYLAKADPKLTALPSTEDGIMAFRQLCAQHVKWSEAKRELETMEQQMLLLEKLDQEDGTVHQLEVTERHLQQLVERHPEWGRLAPERPKTEYEQQIREITSQIEAAQTEVIRMRHTLESQEMNHTLLADLLEQQAAAAERYARLTHLHGRVTKATTMLEGATAEFQRAFAPRLETRIAQALSTVTSGRYQQVQVDPADLGLSVYSPESGGWVSGEHLSTGTRDLIYLAMRVAVSDLLSSNREPLPLLLDDPFVHFDAIREQKALTYLSDIAKDYQVLFFSKDHTLVDRLRHTGQSVSVTRLDLM